jgi:hypothetical protein
MAGELSHLEHDVAHPAETAHGDHGGEHGKPPTSSSTDPAKAKKRREYLIIIATLVGVVLTFILYERSKSSSSSTTPTTTSTGSDGASATDPAAEAGVQGLAQAFNALAAQDQSNQATNASAQAGLQALLSTLGTEVTSLQSQVNGIPAAYGGGTTAGQSPTSESSPSASGPPALSATLSQQLAGNGEFITDVVADTQGGWLYLTNKGGVYNEGGSPNYGSYLGLPAATRNQTGEFNVITPTAGGGYTESDTQGSSYAFNQGTAAQGIGL